ncbi:hypothetical protein GGC65_001334 [Sphingopyxis sp. OAS728]|uniref:hypothetical protein n=1 Tax=Sphingopyxis sp. OAS728 TaxID=2663823 RepID=UPI00178A64B2|nr:hypothetical protein [Sphingopyxis sp. OAS728]MBE1526878.1 hypothetical protein [Sphingopyxis sp. OAS728]
MTPDAFDVLHQANELVNELQARIRARGVELKEAGTHPASREQVAAWNASWVPLVSNLPGDEDPRHWA